MYRNILSLITRVLTPDVVASMSQAAGISDPAMAQKAAGVAVPAVLSSLAGLVTKPEGGRRLAEIITKQSPDNLEDIAGRVGGSQPFADAGKDMLSTLLGSGSFNGLVSGIAKFIGINESAMGSMLGMLAPVILGVLGREAGSTAGGLTQLLSSQKDAFAAAMPSGLSDLLTTAGLGARIGSAASSPVRAEAAYRDRSTIETAAAHVGNPSRGRASSNWLYWAVPLAAVAALALYFLGGDRTTRQTSEIVPPTKNEAAPTILGAVTPAELQRQIAASVTALASTLQGAKDGASVGAILPRLQQSSGELDRLAAVAERLPPEAKARLAEAIRSAGGQAARALANADAMQDLPPDAHPLITALRARIDDLVSAGAASRSRAALIAEKVVYLAHSPQGAVLISGYFDRGVQNGAGEKIGTVNDLLLGSDGKIVAVVLGVGGFLGLGEKEVTVPFSIIRVVGGDNDWHLLFDTTKDALRDAPSFQHAGERVHLDPRPAATQK